MNFWEANSWPKDVPALALLVALSGVAVSALALAAGRLLRCHSAPVRHGVLFGGVIAMLAAPVLVAFGQSLNGLFAVTTEETVKIPANQLSDVITGSGMKVPPAPPPSSDAGDMIGAVLIAAWALGMAFGLAGLVRGLWKQRRALAGEPWQPEWWTDQRRRALAEKVGLRRFPPVWRSPLAPMPMVLGLCRPRIVLPESAPWGQAQWEAVLLHEAAHIRRRDQWAALAQRLAVIHFWWCPLVYRLSRRLNEVREGICDGYALEGPCDRFAYAQLLVETADRLVTLKTVAVGLLDSARGGLEARITRLLAKEKRPMTRLTLAGKLLGAAALVLAGLTIMAASAYSQAPPPQKKIQIKIIFDGKELDLNEETIQLLLAKQRDDARIRRKRLSLMRALELDNANDPLFIEALIREAEKLKPGSGPAVRKALQQALYESLGAGRKEAIEKLSNEAERLTPGSGAKFLFYLKAGGAKLNPGQRVPPPVELDFYPPSQALILKDSRIAVATEPGEVLLFDIKVDADTLKKLEKSGLKIVPGSMVPRDGQPVPKDPKEISWRIKDLQDAGKLQEAAAYAEYLKAVGAMAGWAKLRREAALQKQGPAKTPDLEAISRQLDRLNVELQELRKRLENPSAPTGPKVPDPPQVQGKIMRVDPDTVIIDIGTDKGLKNNQTLDLFRLHPEPKNLGKIRIEDAQVRQSVGRLLFNIEPEGRRLLHVGHVVTLKLTEQ
jgi:beta-lactamase regulating signal transducer with metallopeptidase domain